MEKGERNQCKEKKTTESDYKESLRVQYQQAVENYRLWDRFIWALPSVVVLVSSAVVAAAFGYLKNHIVAQSFIFLVGAMLSLTMCVVLRKYRFFQKRTINRMRDIENDLKIEKLPLITDKDMDPKGWWEKQHAGDWLVGTIMLTFSFLLALFVLNLLTHFELVSWFNRAEGTQSVSITQHIFK